MTQTTLEKQRYHHGDLKEALITASLELVRENGAEQFSLADACRRAGVSTAAPYKHFRDRDEVLEIIVSRGFQELSDRSMEAVRAHGVGTLEGIVAMGRSYVAFAVSEQALFRLMFGQRPRVKSAEAVMEDGHSCFGSVIEQVGIYCDRNTVQGDAKRIAVRLWTFVHGAASLLIDEDYAVVAPELDVDGMIAEVTPKLLSP